MSKNETYLCYRRFVPYFTVLLIVTVCIGFYLLYGRKSNGLSQDTTSHFTDLKNFTDFTDLKDHTPITPITPIHVYRIQKTLDFNQPSLTMNKTIQEIIDDHFPSMVYAKHYDLSHFLVFESLNNIDSHMLYLAGHWPTAIKFIMGIQGTDMLVSKSALARKLSNTSILPQTYIVSDPVEMDRFAKEYDPHAYYILKKNIQRQQGFVITNKMDDILYHFRNNGDKFVVCQKMLQEPYIIDGLKINLRVYLLIIIEGLNVNWYFYQDGFVYYTPKPFVRNTDVQENVITSGYVDRKMYDDHPMTHIELREAIGDETYRLMHENIRKALEIVKSRYSKVFREQNIDIPGTKFSLFGCDFAPDYDMNMSLLEINKGPDIGYKDARDKAVKYNLILAMFQLIGIVEGNENENEKKKEKKVKSEKKKSPTFVKV